MKHRLAIMTLMLVVALAVAPRLEGRDFPPLIPLPAPFSAPVPAVRSLENGLQVVVLESHALPVVTLTLAVKSGAEADPPALPGTAQFVASMLNEGTSARSAQQIARALDDVGAVFDSAAEWDDSWASLSVLSEHAPLAFELLADMAENAAFSPPEVDRARRQTLSALDILRHDPGYVADTTIRRVIFQGTPYSHPSDGVEESLSRLTSGDLRNFHDRYYRPSNAILVVVGDVSANQALRLADERFRNWKGSALAAPASRHPASGASPQATGLDETAPRLVVIDDPNSVQTEIRIATPAVHRDNSSYDALTVANQVLGGPAENVLFTALRTRRGLVYGASSSLLAYRRAGAWEIKTSTQTADAGRAVQLILSQMKHLNEHAISNLELQNAQNYLVGHMELDFETSRQIAQHILKLMVYNLPMVTWNRRVADFRNLSTGAVWAVTKQHLNPAKAAIVLVGNAAGFGAGLKDLGPARIIPFSRVDFGSASLERTVTVAAGAK